MTTWQRIRRMLAGAVALVAAGVSITVALRQSGSRQRLRQLEQEFRGNTRDLRTTLSALSAEIASTRAVRYH